jgi:hypothetical protein
VASHSPLAYNAVISVVGAMFAPHDQQTAGEMLRVCKPGGVIAMINWTPEGLIGQLFATMRPYAPAPPPGVQPPPLWGNESHVRGLFGDGIAVASFTRARVTTPPQISTPVEFREFFKIHYGPTIAVYDALADRPDARAALDRDFERFLAETDARIVGTSTAQWERWNTCCSSPARRKPKQIESPASTGCIGLVGGIAALAMRGRRVFQRQPARVQG